MTDPQAPAVPRERDPDLVTAEIALQRAALRARQKAWRHGFPHAEGQGLKGGDDYD